MMMADPMILDRIFSFAAIMGSMALAGWLVTTWLKVRNGYPLGGMWGRQAFPRGVEEAAERVALITQENAQLRAELGAVKDRLATVERIVTDGSFRLDREIEHLRG